MPKRKKTITKTEPTQASSNPVRSPIQQKFLVLRHEMRSVFHERNDIIDGLLTAIIAGEHVLLLGPPGTAKSLSASVMCQAIDGARYFERLLTKFSTPEEVFGPPSVKELKENDRYVRQTRGKLPEAHIAFVDECFKANSSILNSMLTIINEREFDNDGRQTVPLITMIGASNELPDGSDLEALFDRFLFRFWVGYIQDRDSLKGMLQAVHPAVKARMTLGDVEMAQFGALQVEFSDVMINTLLDVKGATETAGVRASDRRWKKIVKALKAFAWLNGEAAVNEDHFDLLADLMWREPKERPALVLAIGRVANPLAAKATQILDAAKELFGKIPDPSAGKVPYLTAAGEANAAFEDMESELTGLIQGNPGKSKRLRDALTEIEVLHKQTQRNAAAAAGVKI